MCIRDRAHIERLDLLRVIGDEEGLLENFLGEIALVLGLEIDAPGNGGVKFLAGLLQKLDGLCIGCLLYTSRCV